MHTSFKNLALSLSLLTASTAAVSQESEDVVELDTFVAESEVSDDLGILQNDPVDSVFGFGKTILETPRAVSSISSEFLDQFNATGINDIVNFVPGTFTTSFFGVAGSLDIRGTAAENYFRGVKRLNNEGNYPTPIGASDRVDVIRGPMSPISGPSKVGGALNFIPKSSRAETGQYLTEPTGEIGYTTGSWDKSVMTAEVGGPTTIMGNSAGYYLYGQVEASDSYYENDFTNQTLFQASFNTDLSSTTRIEFGGMYQDWESHENGGWNRVTQDLVDNGTYITGQPLVNIDSEFGDGNGLISGAEIDAWEATLAGVAVDPDTGYTCFTGISVFCHDGSFGPIDPSLISQMLVDQLEIGLDPATVGTATLDTSDVLITDYDTYDTQVTTFYFDIFHDMAGGWTLTNKVLYDAQEYINVDSYGFTKVADAWMVEDQLIFAKTFEFDSGVFDLQLSPSYRYTDAFYALDFSDEIFDRTDLTEGFNALSIQEAASRVPTESWSDYWNSSYSQLGFSIMTDTQIGNFSAVLGARYDYVDAEGENGDGAGPVVLTTFDPEGEHEASNSDSGVTWTASLSYTFNEMLTPYVTMAEQSTIVSGSAGDLDTQNIAEKSFLGDSELTEFGLKGNFLDGRLFAAVAVYEQERIAFSSQNPVSNQATTTEGVELEFRYVPTDKLSLIGTYSNSETLVVNPGGVTFSYFGASDMPLVDPSTWYAGIIGGNVVVGEETLRGGIPESTMSLSGSYAWTDSLTTSLSVTSVDEVASSVLGGLILPSYTLVNGSVVYNTDDYKIGLYLNNITDETYFRGNFPSLYGNNAILPELPFSWTAEFAYKF